MANTNASERDILLAFKTVGIEKVTADITRLNNGLLSTAEVSKRFGATAKLSETALRQIGAEARIAQKGLHSLQMKFLTLGLSMLFTGMALQRFSKGVLMGLFDTLKKVEGSQTTLEKAVTRMSASFEFLKFSIMEALNGSFIESFIIQISRVIMRLADWISQNPLVASSILLILGALFALGSAMVFFGQLLAGMSGAWQLFFLPLGKFIGAAWDKLVAFFISVKSLAFVEYAAIALSIVGIFLAAIAAITILLELSGIKTQWKATLGFIADGWKDLWDGIATFDMTKVELGLREMFYGIGMFTINLFIGIAQMITKIFADLITTIVSSILSLPALAGGIGNYLKSIQGNRETVGNITDALFDSTKYNQDDVDEMRAKLEVEMATKGMTAEEKKAYLLKRARDLAIAEMEAKKDKIDVTEDEIDVLGDLETEIDKLQDAYISQEGVYQTGTDIALQYETQLNNITTSSYANSDALANLSYYQEQLTALTNGTTTSTASLTEIMGGPDGAEGTLSAAIDAVSTNAQGLGNSFTEIREEAYMTQAGFIGVNTEIKGIPDNLFNVSEAAVNTGDVITGKTDMMGTNFDGVKTKVAGLTSGVNALKSSIDALHDKTITITTIYVTKHKNDSDKK